MSDTISLSLTENYAPSWRTWEGFVQNWYDGLLSSVENLPPKTNGRPKLTICEAVVGTCQRRWEFEVQRQHYIQLASYYADLANSNRAGRQEERSVCGVCIQRPRTVFLCRVDTITLALHVPICWSNVQCADILHVFIDINKSHVMFNYVTSMS